MHCMTAFVIKKFLFREFDFIHVELSSKSTDSTLLQEIIGTKFTKSIVLLCIKEMLFGD